MRILCVASEVYPLVKTGGLADVVGALPAALAALGEDVRVMVPGYPAALAGVEHLGGWRSLGDPLGSGATRLGLGRLPGNGVPVWMVECPKLYDRSGGPYLDRAGADWPDNAQRFALLARAAAFVCEDGATFGWRPDILHAHDWQTGLAPAYLASRTGNRPASVFTLHNAQYQGLFPASALAAVGLPPESFTTAGVEYHGYLSFLKAGLHYADGVNTVSPTYARELLTPDGGMGMEGVLAAKGARFSGILNGIDTHVWDPGADPHIAHPYSPARLQDKLPNKTALQRECGLEEASQAPLLGVIGRLTPQKGLDLLVEALPELLAQGAQAVVLGTGDRALEAALLAEAVAHPRQVHVRIGYDEAFAHRIQAGCDAFLVPSRFEPCGLTQMCAMRYGTVPIVRQTGGLADTVLDASSSEDGTGFVFGEASSADLAAAVARAIRAYRQPAAWQALQRRAMQRDFSWDASARQYRDLFLSVR
jgi:starch synthase